MSSARSKHASEPADFLRFCSRSRASQVCYLTFSAFWHISMEQILIGCTKYHFRMLVLEFIAERLRLRVGLHSFGSNTANTSIGEHCLVQDALSLQMYRKYFIRSEVMPENNNIDNKKRLVQKAGKAFRIECWFASPPLRLHQQPPNFAQLQPNFHLPLLQFQTLFFIFALKFTYYGCVRQWWHYKLKPEFIFFSLRLCQTMMNDKPWICFWTLKKKTITARSNSDRVSRMRK